ncbi:MAG TPA: replication-associated recombination protein A [Ignavibacteria bacterium]|nr:AAA family ATPase [Bacteroidota bacterium]HRI85279.1 replication-associated recombination protein A [Ignavibacteria bacterium]HRK00625.1 replication-associated recombination protein A [Ignavibacteria bacterium]
MDLFGNVNDKETDYNIPLAERMRPADPDSFAGQDHLIAPGKPIRTMIEKNEPVSMIFWGPPGVGKTTLALLISRLVKTEFVQLSAVSSGVKDVRAAIEKAEYNLKHKKRKTILFIDEIHRFSKSQQDSLLQSSEKGTIILIGATTENPSFEVISPLLSRSRVFVLEELSKKNFEKIIENALSKDVILKEKKIEIEDRDFLIGLASGDARKLLNGLELAVKLTSEDQNGIIRLTNDIFKEAFQANYIKYDKNQEEHYNIISAFIKSIRGSDPDAALYWMARMLKGGEDPKFIARRMIVLASEDIGNADPLALTIAVSAFTAIDYIGMPEATLVLSQAAVYLAAAPKSNASYLAISNAKEDVENNPAYGVPMHLRNAPTKLMKDLNYGSGYKYPHDYENNFTQQDYLPEEIKNKIYYEPSENGAEAEMRKRLKKIWDKRK